MATIKKYCEQRGIKPLSENSKLCIPCYNCGDKLNLYLTYVVEDNTEAYLICEKCKEEFFG